MCGHRVLVILVDDEYEAVPQVCDADNSNSPLIGVEQEINKCFPQSAYMRRVVRSVEEARRLMARESYQCVLLVFTNDVIACHIDALLNVAQLCHYPTLFVGVIYCDPQDDREDDYVGFLPKASTPFEVFDGPRFNTVDCEWSTRLAQRWGDHMVGVQAYRLSQMAVL